MIQQSTPIAFSGDIPVSYDAHLGPMFFEPYAMALAERIAKLAPKQILELASGTGRLTALLPVVAPNATIVASDLNPAMVRFGSEKVKHPSVRWMEVDALTLPFDDASFDVVVVQFGVMFYSDRAKAFLEARRVLKPGGTLLFNSWDAIQRNPMAQLAANALEHFFPNDTPAFYTIPFSYFDKKTIESELSQAGFSGSNIEEVALTGYSPSAKDAAAGLINGTPTVTAIQDRDSALLPVLLNYLEGTIEERFGKKILEVPLQALVVSGRV